MPFAKMKATGRKVRQSPDNRSSDPKDRLHLLPSQLSNHFIPPFPAGPVGGMRFDPEPDPITEMREEEITRQSASGQTCVRVYYVRVLHRRGTDTSSSRRQNSTTGFISAV